VTFVDGSAPPAFLGRDSGHAPVVDGRTPILAERRGVADDHVVVAAEALDRDLAGAGFKP
jgi:hypothetical protein